MCTPKIEVFILVPCTIHPPHRSQSHRYKIYSDPVRLPLIPSKDTLPDLNGHPNSLQNLQEPTSPGLACLPDLSHLVPLFPLLSMAWLPSPGRGRCILGIWPPHWLLRWSGLLSPSSSPGWSLSPGSLSNKDVPSSRPFPNLLSILCPCGQQRPLLLLCLFIWWLAMSGLYKGTSISIYGKNEWINSCS